MHWGEGRGEGPVLAFFTSVMFLQLLHSLVERVLHFLPAFPYPKNWTWIENGERKNRVLSPLYVLGAFTMFCLIFTTLQCRY